MATRVLSNNDHSKPEFGPELLVFAKGSVEICFVDTRGDIRTKGAYDLVDPEIIDEWYYL